MVTVRLQLPGSETCMRPFEFCCLALSFLAAGVFAYHGIWFLWIIPVAVLIGVVLDRLFPEIGENRSWFVARFIPAVLILAALLTVMLISMHLAAI